jgi:hypothetical protein
LPVAKARGIYKGERVVLVKLGIRGIKKFESVVLLNDFQYCFVCHIVDPRVFVTVSLFAPSLIFTRLQVPARFHSRGKPALQLNIKVWW